MSVRVEFANEVEAEIQAAYRANAISTI